MINSSPKNALRTFQPFLSIFAPVGTGCLLAMVFREDIPAKLIDEQISPDVLGEINHSIKGLLGYCQTFNPSNYNFHL